MRLLKSESVYEKAIIRDLSRTFTSNEYFQTKDGQDALFNVAKAYSLYDAEVGYCQSVLFIAGPLLLNVRKSIIFWNSEFIHFLVTQKRNWTKY